GTRKTGLFQRHRLWQSVKNQVILPKKEDQTKIHSLIYEIKGKKLGARQIESLQSLLRSYEVDSYIAGCTEMHILAKEQERISGIDRRTFCIDPLTIVASIISDFTTSAADVDCRYKADVP